MGYNGSHAIRLCIVVGSGQNIAGALSRARAQTWQRTPNESKPAARTWIASDIRNRALLNLLSAAVPQQKVLLRMATLGR